MKATAAPAPDAAPEAPPPAPAGPPAQAARAELNRVLASPAFADALAHQRLLRHLVECTLAGHTAGLKESVLGIEVFQRPAHTFDPKRDSIVRVEARRLRERLRRHYAQDSAASGGDSESRCRIVLPSGSYVPQFVPCAADDAQAQADELVQRGQYFLRQGHEEGYRKALERFQAAAHTVPACAAAHAGVARAWLQLVATNLEPPQPGVSLSLAAVHRALQLQPAHADSLVLAAQLTHRFEFNWGAAKVLYDRALRATPDSAYVHHALALSQMMRGEFDTAERALGAARRIDPLHLGLRAHQALLSLYRRHWPAAEAELSALLDLSPDNVLGMSLLAYVWLCNGRPDAALAQYRRVAQVHPQLSIGPCGQVWAQAALGQRAQAREGLVALQAHWQTQRQSQRQTQRHMQRYLSPYQLAMAECWLGNAAPALTLLERAVQERDPNALCLPVDPAFDALAGEYRFQLLRQQVLGAPTNQAL